MSTPPDSPVSRTTDIVVAWILYAMQVAGEAVLALVWLTSVMMTDSCGTGTDDPAVCNAAYFMTWWFAYAALLVVAVLATPVAILVAGHRRRPRWPWPALAILLLAAATAGYIFAFTR